jgi:hypothetical protein
VQASSEARKEWNISKQTLLSVDLFVFFWNSQRMKNILEHNFYWELKYRKSARERVKYDAIVCLLPS